MIMRSFQPPKEALHFNPGNRVFFMDCPGRIRAAEVLSIIVSLSGAAVIFGWIFDLPVLKSISPAWISMKFDTALAFVFSGLIIYFITRAKMGRADEAQIGIFISSLVVFILMGILFFSYILGINTGAEGMFVQEKDIAANTIVPGRPSLPTTINFLLLASAGMLCILNKKFNFWIRVIGLVVGGAALSAIAGYILRSPRYYFYWEGLNCAMALHTAVLFLLSAIGLLCLSN
jgi:hypothetical protein